jgi:hypothetical protein
VGKTDKLQILLVEEGNVVANSSDTKPLE